MRHTIGLALCATLLGPQLTHAQETGPQLTQAQETTPSNPMTEALNAQLQRSLKELTLKDAPEIYHLRYHLLSMDQVDVVASLGSLLDSNTKPYRLLSIELRVGSPEFDNTGFGGWENGFTFDWLPDNLSPRTASVAAWRLTDQAYKQAIEQYARKKAQFRPPADYPGDYTLVETTTTDRGAATIGDSDALIALATELSATLSGNPAIEAGEVQVGHEAGAHWILDSNQAVIRRPVSETTLRAFAHVRAPDGMLLTDHRLWTTRSPEQLTGSGPMTAELSAMRDHLLALRDAAVLNEEYVGPVLFEGDATIELFRKLLVPQLEGTPPEVPFESFLGDLGGGSGSPVRLGRRVLPPGWTVIDDPRARPDHPSFFQIDAEGTPTEAVTPVQDGIVQNVLMSRVPRSGVEASNGHARGSLRERLSGRITQLSVVAERTYNKRQIHKRAARLATAYGRDYYLVIRRFQEPSTRGAGQSMMSYIGAGGDSDTQLPLPVSVFRVYLDGRVEELRGARFAGVQRWALRDIAAAGQEVGGSFMIPASRGYNIYGPTQGLPAWMTAPNVLIGEMELIPAPGDPNDNAVLPHPLAQSADSP